MAETAKTSAEIAKEKEAEKAKEAAAVKEDTAVKESPLHKPRESCICGHPKAEHTGHPRGDKTGCAAQGCHCVQYVSPADRADSAMKPQRSNFERSS